jgi:hypothetical protein
MAFYNWAMRRYISIAAVFVIGAAALVPAIAYLGLDPMPGDFIINHGNLHMAVPVTYSLCVSMSLGLLYYFAKR